MQRIFYALRMKLHKKNKKEVRPSLLRIMKKDADVRIRCFLCTSFLFNIFYSLFLFCLGVIYHSNWFFVMGVYFFALAIFRLTIFYFIVYKPDLTKRQENNAYMAYGWLLLFLNLWISVLIFPMIFKRQPTAYHEIVVIALATYTFSTMSVGIVNFIRYVKHPHLLYRALRIISLITASVSMLTLANTMMATWGKDNLILRYIVLCGLGAAISLLIIFLSFYIIKTAKRNAKELNNAKN